MSTSIEIKKRIAVKDEGGDITTDVNSINFVGDGVVVSATGNDAIVTIPGAYGLTTFYLNESQNQAPYKEFSSNPTTGPEQTVTTLVPADGTAIVQSFQTPTGVPNTTNIPGGRWAFYLHFSGTPLDSWSINVEIYKRTTGGIETLLLVTDVIGTTSLSGTPTMILTDGILPPSTLLTTDRIVVKVIVTNNDSLNAKTITFHTEGTTNYSIGSTTLNQSVPTGAVTSVTGTAPITSSGGTTPAISISQATASTNGYLSSSDWTIFNAKQDGLVSGSNIKTVNSNSLLGAGNVSVGTVTSVGLTTGTTGVDVNVSGSPVTGSGSITLNIPTASATNRGVLSTTDWTTFNNKQNSLGYTPENVANKATTMTGNESSNIIYLTAKAIYDWAIGLFVQTTRSLTINGSTQDLSANRTWNVGTVTSVGLTLGTAGTDVGVSGSPVTGASSITLNIPIASSVNTGKLSSTDWTTFNNKLSQAYSTVQDEGAPLTQRSTINFVGAGVTVTDDGVSKTTVTIPGGGGGSGGWTITTQSGASYSATNGDYVLINTATQTVTLPVASVNARVGVKMIFATVTNIQVKTASATVTIDGVDRSTTGLSIYNQYDALTFISDGTNWFIES